MGEAAAEIDWRQEPVMLPYQQRWIADKSPMKVCEKGRRVGITWATAGDCVLDAAQGLHDVWYIGYSEDQAVEFVRDSEYWVRALGLVGVESVEKILVDEDGDPVHMRVVEESDILAFRIKFASGKRITALSSRPRNLRGKSGRVIIDEAAFHDDLRGLIKAAVALLMWGGRVEIISTHNGIDSEFNRLLEDIRDGKFKYSLHRITLDDALEEGLYQRICHVKGELWSEERQTEWRQELIDHYGVGADEELFCVPMLLSEGMLFSREWFPIVTKLPKITNQVRFWDLAATPKKPKNDPDFSAGVLLGKHEDGVVIMGLIKVRKKPKDMEDLLKHTASVDGRKTMIGYEEEPGSSGKFLSAHLKDDVLRGYRFEPRRSTGDKVSRARPASAEAQRGRVWVLDGPYVRDLLTSLYSFPFGPHDDDVDGFTGAFNLLVGEGAKFRNYLAGIQNR